MRISLSKSHYNIKIYPDKKRLYLDIDEVLLTTKLTRPSENVIEIIDYILEHFDCYWITTHCNADSNREINYLSQYFDDKVLQKLQHFKPSNWFTLKTEAFDFTTDFIWLEDYPFLTEIAFLKTYKVGCSESSNHFSTFLFKEFLSNLEDRWSCVF